MRNTMCRSKWHSQKHRLMKLKPSEVILSVADNHQITSKGMWTGTVDVAGTVTTQSLEIFKSNSTFQVILGKLWLHSIQAIHRYNTDEITIQAQGHMTTITNDNGHLIAQTMTKCNPGEATGCPTAKRQQVTAEDMEPQQMRAIDEAPRADPGEKANKMSQRATDPANPEWVQAILEKISIGTDLTNREKMAVTDLKKEYPDIFAFSLSEVFPVNFVTHKLKLDPNIR